MNPAADTELHTLTLGFFELIIHLLHHSRVFDTALTTDAAFKGV